MKFYEWLITKAKNGLKHIPGIIKAALYVCTQIPALLYHLPKNTIEAIKNTEPVHIGIVGTVFLFPPLFTLLEIYLEQIQPDGTCFYELAYSMILIGTLTILYAFYKGEGN